MWTLAEANVECRVMSGAAATDADDAGRAEERKCARGWNNREPININADGVTRSRWVVCIFCESGGNGYPGQQLAAPSCPTASGGCHELVPSRGASQGSET